MYVLIFCFKYARNRSISLYFKLSFAPSLPRSTPPLFKNPGSAPGYRVSVVSCCRVNASLLILHKQTLFPSTLKLGKVSKYTYDRSRYDDVLRQVQMHR